VRYRPITPKARLVPLTPPFLSYLRADGIVLPPDDPASGPQGDWSDGDSGIYSSAEDPQDDTSDDDEDPSIPWRDVHNTIADTIQELGGSVVPKLNWSAPKDATWINTTNSMDCRSPGDIYLLLKSSDFVTHDLEHAFDDCVVDGESSTPPEIPYHLVLRKTVQQFNPALEFRCFVRDSRLIALCQRDPNHFEFLFKLQDQLLDAITRFFEKHLQDSFPDPCFAFDVYIPPPHNRVWLVDINPWALRTDPLLYSWMELLTIPGPEAWEEDEEKAVEGDSQAPQDDADSDGSLEELEFVPEFRLVKRDDPEAYGFATQQYSAHKLPKDVVDASRGGESQLREFANQWQEMLERQYREEQHQSSGDDDE
jgi:hypothetical protein